MAEVISKLRTRITAIGLALLVISTLVAYPGLVNNSVFAQYGSSSGIANGSSGSMNSNTMMMQMQMHTVTGQISNVQLGGNGQPAWIQSGWWILRIYPQTSTHTTVWFLAKIAMVKPDGTAPHAHSIYNFMLSDLSTEGNSTFVFKGTATVVMPNGPVPGVPVTIKVLNMNVFAIWIGPDQVNGHFGSAPLYGTVFHSGDGHPFSAAGIAMMGEPMTMMKNLKYANVPIAIPLEKGLYDNKHVFFMTPEISDQSMAAYLTSLTKFPVTFAPALANTPQNQALGNIYIFKNGVKGAGAMGFQADVFDSIPGDAAYTPLWRVNFVEWKASGINATTPTLLGSDNAVLGAASNSQVTVTPTGIVRNCPIIQWGGNKDNTISAGHMTIRANFTLTDNTPYGGGQLLNIDTTGLQATFVAHRAFGPDGSTVYHIVLDASVNATAKSMGIIYTNNTAAIALSNASSDTFSFANGLAGSGPEGFQPDIGSANPGDMTYTPMEKIRLVSWTDPSKAILLQSTRDMQTYGDQVKVVDTGMIIDSPAFNATTVMEHMNMAQPLTSPTASPPTSSNAPSNTTTMVSIQPNAPSLAGNAFSPNPVSIKVGDTVTWTNNDVIMHTVTSRTGLYAFNIGKEFDSGLSGSTALTGNGKVFSHQFNTAGVFQYFCQIHPQMVGQITVS